MRRLRKTPRTNVHWAGPVRLVSIGLAIAAAISGVAMARHGKHKFSTTYTINFSLSQGYTTSAGIFNSQGNLVRTLWGNQPLAAGTYQRTWDGNDDRGNALPSDTYTVKLLTHNITANWDGVIGNSSTYQTGSTHLHGYGSFSDVTSVGSTVYMLRQFNEGGDQVTKFDRGAPGIYSPSGANAVPISYWPSCFSTDGTHMYVGMEPSLEYTNNPNGMVMAYNLDEVTGAWTFTGVAPIAGTGQGANNGGQWLVMGNNSVTSAAFPTSIAVQTGGNVLAVAQQGLNQVLFYDKLAGTALPGAQGFLSVPGVTAVRWSPDNKTLWASSGSNVVGWQYNGSTWSATTTIAGTQHVRGFNVNPADGSVAILYAGTDQQLRAYSPSGTWLYTIGARGGYSTGPAVNDTKFMVLTDQPGIDAIGAGVGFQTDGKLWILDAGNNRMLRFPVHKHLAAARKDAEVRMINGYDLAVDQNNPDHMIIEGYLEFQRDYTQPLSAGMDTAWKLVNNYGYGYMGFQVQDAMVDGITEMVTASNGHIYGVLEPAAVLNMRELVEITPTGLRLIAPFTDEHLRPDMSSWATQISTGNTVVYRRTLSGFDGSNNPIWSTPAVYCSFPNGGGTAGFAGGMTSTGHYPSDILPDGSFVSFNTTANPSDYSTYYLGFVKPNANNFWAQSAMSAMCIPLTHDGHMPVGLIPSVTYPDFDGRVNGDFVAMFANGEFFDQAELCQILLYHKSGLPILDFGSRSIGGVTNTAPSGMAGNAAGNAFVTCSDGNYRILHTDESKTGGVHEWTLQNITSLSVASATFDGSNTANFGTAASSGSQGPSKSNSITKAASATKAPTKGVIITSTIGSTTTSGGTTTIVDGFGRGNSSTVGNGWMDVNSTFEIANGLLESAAGFGNEFGNILIRPETGTDSDQTISIPAQFTQTTPYWSPNETTGAFGVVSRYQPDGSRYFAEAVYLWWPSNHSANVTNGMWQIEIGMYIGNTRYVMAGDTGYYLPAQPGHSYKLELTTTGISPTYLHLVMTDTTTGQKYAVVDQQSDEPSLQKIGGVGIQGGFRSCLFSGYSASVTNGSLAGSIAGKRP